MGNVSSFFDTNRVSGIIVATVFSFLLVALLTYGATTVGSNINTAGTLTVSGATTLNGNVTLGDAGGDVITLTGNASTTNSLTVAKDLFVGGFATTTGANGNIATEGTLYVIGSSTLSSTLTVGGATTFTGIPTFRSALRASSTADFTGAFATYGATTLGDAGGDSIIITGNATTSNSLTVNKDLYVEGTASTTLLVGNGSAINSLVVGTCDVNPGISVSASTTQGVVCKNATGVRVGDKVFIMATSSEGMAANIVITAASSSASNQIGIWLANATTTVGGLPASFGPTTVNFWAAR